MKGRVIYVERKPSDSVSIERVFRQIAKDLPAERFDTVFSSVPYGNGITAVIKNLMFYSAPAADVYHITGDIHYIALCLPRDKTVLTIHDLIFLHRRTGLRRYILKKLFLDLPIRRTTHITVVSKAVKDEIIEHTGIEANRITVIENPLIEGFDPGRTKPFDHECPLILHIGTAENKNLERLITAINGIHCRLRIVGRLDDKMLDSLDANGTKYENVHGLSEIEMVREYRNADLVSFCSTYEGFGLPIIEAQSMRKPVVTSRLSPMIETSGGAAVLVDPNDHLSIRNGFQKVITDVVFREHLIAAGLDNTKRFSREKVAASYEALYKRILETRP